jgi:hypothetical protein
MMENNTWLLYNMSNSFKCDLDDDYYIVWLKIEKNVVMLIDYKYIEPYSITWNLVPILMASKYLYWKKYIISNI